MEKGDKIKMEFSWYGRTFKKKVIQQDKDGNIKHVHQETQRITEDKPKPEDYL